MVYCVCDVWVYDVHKFVVGYEVCGGGVPILDIITLWMN